MTPPQRFIDKFEKMPDGCWTWQAAKQSAGYGMFSWQGKPTLAHRLAYTWEHGEIPAGKVIDHLCRNVACVNPQHLEAVSGSTNVMRGKRSALASAKTHCKHGHELTPENSVVRSDTGKIRCRLCRNRYVRENYQRQLT